MPPLMTLLQKRPDRLRMIELAMKEKAPQTYLALKKSGTLNRVIEAREEEMMAAYEEQESALRDRDLRKADPDHLQRLRDWETGTREIWEGILSVYLEFEDADSEPPTTA